LPPILIPTFPPELREVPQVVPNDLESNKAWFDWRSRVIAYRNEVHFLCDDDPAYRVLEAELCAQDPARWIALWLYIEEPRVVEGEAVIKPYVPFAFQVELAQWWAEKTGQPGRYDGFVSKSRGLGATWIFTAMATWAWLFRDWRGMLISRKEDLVDKRHDLNSMFGKIDFILDQLPEWMLPPGFDPTVHRQKNFLNNPATNAAIIGEATSSKSTRGGRATYIVYDEAAFIPKFKDVFGTGAGTSNHRWGVSSESFEDGDDWYLLWNGAKKRDPGAVRELDYYLNPYFDAYWYAAEQMAWEDDPEGFQREYLRDPFAGAGTWVYPTIRQREKEDPTFFVEEGFDPSELLLVGIDPGRADDTAIVFMQFAGDDHPRTARWINSYSANLKPAEYYAHILTGIPPAPGDVCYAERFDDYATQVIMPWMRSLPWSGAMRVFCDPAGSQTPIDGLSFTDRLLVASKKLRARELDRMIGAGEVRTGQDAPRVVPIVPLYEELFSSTQHDKRRLALRKLLLSSVFSRNRGALRIVEALKYYRFSEGTNATTSQPTPIHDEHSHLVSAAEYVAVYADMGLGRIKAARDRKKTTFKDPLTGMRRG
jgi:hypothetical protein